MRAAFFYSMTLALRDDGAVSVQPYRDLSEGEDDGGTPGGRAGPRAGASRRHARHQSSAAAAAPNIFIQARAEAKSDDKAGGGNAAQRPKLLPKGDGDFLGYCAWERCSKPRISKNPVALRDGSVLVCHPDCGKRALHETCAADMVAHYGSDDVSERFACERCDGVLSLRHYVRDWDSWSNRLGAAWDLLRVSVRFLLRRAIPLLFLLCFLHRALWFVGVYRRGPEAVDRVHNPGFAPGQALALTDFFSYRFAWHPADPAAASAIADAVASMRVSCEEGATSIYGCRFWWNYTRPSSPSASPSLSGAVGGGNAAAAMCVARWYPGFLFDPLGCEFSHLAGLWLFVSFPGLLWSVLGQYGLVRTTLAWLGWGLLQLLTVGMAHVVSRLWYRARRRRLNARRNRRRPGQK